MKKYIYDNKKNILIVSCFIIFLIILTIIVNLLHNNDNKLLISSYVSRLKKEDITLNDNACDLDYVLKYNNIPYFNLSNETYDKLNNEIMYNFLLRACYQNGEIDYETSLNNNILSLAINISYETTDDMAYLEYKTYNIDTLNNSIISNQELLNKYNITLQEASNKFLEKLTEFYNYEVKNNLVDLGTTFTQYLEILKYEPITLNNMILFIDNKNDLYLIKEYELSEGMRRDENFPNLSIKFKLT